MQWWLWRIGRIAWNLNRGTVDEGTYIWRPVLGMRLCVRMPNAQNEARHE